MLITLISILNNIRSASQLYAELVLQGDQRQKKKTVWRFVGYSGYVLVSETHWRKGHYSS